MLYWKSRRAYFDKYVVMLMTFLNTIPCDEYCNTFNCNYFWPRLILERKNVFVRDDLDDPWHVLRSPKRLMQGFANFDGSPQLLVYDMNTYAAYAVIFKWALFNTLI